MSRILLILALAFLPSRSLAAGDSLRTEIQRIAGSFSGRVGVSIGVIEDRDTLTINGNQRFPMQSVYKFPLALAILHEVDTGKFTLEQKIHVTQKDLLPNTWSPLREKYPQGNVDITLAELLAYTVSESDNNGCDILFRLVGGTNTVERYIHGLGVENIAIATTEEEMHKGWEVQYRNWSTPAAMGQLLSMFYQDKILSKKTKEFLWELMVYTKTGPRRLKGLLREGSIVAHKTGSSGANGEGLVAATNDVGILSLPNGKHVVVVAFVSDAATGEEACERVIAGIAKAAWEYYENDTLAHEQYVVINIAPEENLQASFQQIHQLMKGRSSERIRLGVGAIFSYFKQSREQCRKELEAFLSQAERYEIPIVVQLDGEQWWGARPDLWNWWDPVRPGYDPENRENVEWSGWGPEYALKIAWRNWGSQMRVLPPPNLMSPRYRSACHDEMRFFVPLILEWWGRLPGEKKSLLLGIKLGWESAIGVNSFYYPDGNALLEQSEDRDPRVELKGDQVPARGVMAIGYAAVTAAHLAERGELQEAHLAEIVRRHLNDLCALAARLGVPRERLFTHVGGWKDEELLYDAALNEYSCPGWSFYRHASDPTKDKGVQRVVQKSDAPYWAAAEWLLMGQNTAEAWGNAIRRTLSDRKCRYMCIYNWSGIKDDREAINAVQGTLGVR